MPVSFAPRHVVALVAGLTLMALPAQGFLAAILDAAQSEDIHFESGTFAPAEDPVTDVQVAKTASAAECSTASFTDGPVAGATFAVDLHDTTATFEYGYLCITNAGNQTAVLKLTADHQVALDEGEVTCEENEDAVEFGDGCDDAAEVDDILRAERYDTNCDNSAPGTTGHAFVGLKTLDEAFEPGESCYVAYRWIFADSPTDTDLARAQTDFYALRLEVRLEDGA